MMTLKSKPLNGNSIKIEEVKKWIENYKRKHPEKPGSFFFGEDEIIRIIGQDEIVGFKVHLAYSDHSSLQLIMVGTKQDGSEMWPSTLQEPGETSGQIAVGVSQGNCI
jgi:hypothetical protein